MRLTRFPRLAIATTLVVTTMAGAAISAPEQPNDPCNPWEIFQTYVADGRTDELAYVPDEERGVVSVFAPSSASACSLGGTSTPPPAASTSTATTIPPTATGIPATNTPIPPTATAQPSGSTVQNTLYITGDMVHTAAINNRYSHHAQIVTAMKTAIPTEAQQPYYLWVGDIQYENGCLAEYTNATKYDDTYKTLPNHDTRVLPVPGNHDTDCVSDNIAALKNNYEVYFGSSVADPLGNDTFHYAKDLGRWRVIVFNQYAVGSTDSLADPEMVWLSDQIDAANTAGDCVIVAGHEPVHSSGASHGNATGQINAGDYVPFKLMYDKGVEIFTMGHEHSYERTFPLSIDANNVIGRDDTYGVASLQVGIGGKENFWLAGQTTTQPIPTIVPHSAKRYSGRWNSDLTDVSNSTISYMLHGWVRLKLYDGYATLSIGREAPGTVSGGTYGVSTAEFNDATTVNCHGPHP